MSPSRQQCFPSGRQQRAAFWGCKTVAIREGDLRHECPSPPHLQQITTTGINFLRRAALLQGQESCSCAACVARAPRQARHYLLFIYQARLFLNPAQTNKCGCFQGLSTQHSSGLRNLSPLLPLLPAVKSPHVHDTVCAEVRGVLPQNKGATRLLGEESVSVHPC